MQPHAAIGVPNLGMYADIPLLLDLAIAAEETGWDGFFLWDHLLARDPAEPVADPQITIAAIAALTERVRLGILIVPLARRRPAKVAKEIATLDHLSQGRMVLGAGLGSIDAEWSAFGEDPDARVRAARLDEALEIIARLQGEEPVSFAGEHHVVRDATLRPVPLQRPRVPIWVGGRWPNRRPFRRAARWDGVMPTHAEHGLGETMPPAALREIVEYVGEHRTDDGPFDVALEGATTGDPEDAGAHVAPYVEAGLTWWVEALGWWRGDAGAAFRRVEAGPPAR
jgi:alkanesulfonate monooxygenase SsuD/methylene tetrahydromethanopterin reductase-like flavin-dependent oxidoreductase (luciferase family)